MKFFKIILVITVLCLFSYGAYLFFNNCTLIEPVYEVSTYNLNGTSNIWKTQHYTTHEFSGTYTFNDINDNFIEVPIKNTNVVQVRQTERGLLD